MKNQTKIGMGIVILFISIFGSNWSHINDWSTPELVGFNLWVVVLTLIGSFFLLKGIISFKKP